MPNGCALEECTLLAAGLVACAGHAGAYGNIPTSMFTVEFPFKVRFDSCSAACAGWGLGPEGVETCEGGQTGPA